MRWTVWPALFYLAFIQVTWRRKTPGNWRISYLCPLSFILRQKKGTVVHKHWVGPSNLVKCKPCPVAQSAMVCGSDGHTYTSKVSFLHCLFFFFFCHQKVLCLLVLTRLSGRKWDPVNLDGLGALPLISCHRNRLFDRRDEIKSLWSL